MTIEIDNLFNEEILDNNKSIIDEDNIIFDEEDILDYCEDDFNYQIISRGEHYYEDDRILRCLKSGNNYYAKVLGSNSNIYDVEINVSFPIDISYNCSCPCDFPCKHEYAVLIAIGNKDYEQVELKEFKKEEIIDIKEILKKIPGDDLKNYIISSKNLNILDNDLQFKDKFLKYFPNQEYEYYYNNLYNEIIISDNYYNLVTTYLNKCNRYILNFEFSEAFKIVKSVIEAFSDTKSLDNEYLIEKIPVITMYLRIIDRKSDQILKDMINDWVDKIKKYNFYDNIYIEDLVLNI